VGWRLGLGTLAALTPKTDEVIYTDDLVKPFDLGRDVDLLGISVDSKTASRRYAIAALPDVGISAESRSRRGLTVRRAPNLNRQISEASVCDAWRRAST
jgi:hypothetical protein